MIMREVIKLGKVMKAGSVRVRSDLMKRERETEREKRNKTRN
jgi:hypothetical protein